MPTFVCNDCGRTGVPPHDRYVLRIEYRRADARHRMGSATVADLCRDCVDARVAALAAESNWICSRERRRRSRTHQSRADRGEVEHEDDPPDDAGRYYEVALPIEIPDVDYYALARQYAAERDYWRERARGLEEELDDLQDRVLGRRHREETK